MDIFKRGDFYYRKATALELAEIGSFFKHVYIQIVRVVRPNGVYYKNEAPEARSILQTDEQLMMIERYAPWKLN